MKTKLILTATAAAFATNLALAEQIQETDANAVNVLEASGEDSAANTEAEVTAGEKVYKWTNADGVTHYSKEPPRKAEAVEQLERVDLEAQQLSTVKDTEVREAEKDLPQVLKE